MTRCEMNMNTYILKSILYLSFGILFLFLNACGDKGRSEVNCQESPNDSWCIEEQKRKAEQQQAQEQEQAKFKSIGDCLKAKKAEAGVSKPTPAMLQQCKGH